MKDTREVMRIVRNYDFVTNNNKKQELCLATKVVDIVNDFHDRYGEFATNLAINEILFEGFMEMSNDEEAILKRENKS